MSSAQMGSTEIVLIIAAKKTLKTYLLVGRGGGIIEHLMTDLLPPCGGTCGPRRPAVGYSSAATQRTGCTCGSLQTGRCAGSCHGDCPHLLSLSVHVGRQG
jgi:hypothetical protein